MVSQFTEDMSFYNANPDGSATLRFRKPGLHDVLSGRGGSVNSHPGNVAFRELVSVRKTEYNLAKNKDNKANICMDVIQKVYNLGGRFLVRDPSSNGWWVELEEERIMAKVSQALREGAPKIREAYKGKRKQRTGTRNAKRVRVDYNGHTVLPRQESPVMERPLAKIVSQNDAPQFPQAPPLILPPPPTNKKLTRVHSLALSDISVGSELLDEFVDPFADEEFPLPPVFSSSSSSSSNNNKGKVSPDTSKPILTVPKVGFLQREASVSSDLGGIGALFRSSNNSNNNSNHSNTHMDVFEQNWRPVSPEQI